MFQLYTKLCLKYIWNTYTISTYQIDKEKKYALKNRPYVIGKWKISSASDLLVGTAVTV